jgi:hypothetical protein
VCVWCMFVCGACVCVWFVLASPTPEWVSFSLVFCIIVSGC